MILLLALACAPQLYSAEGTVWQAPENNWPATDQLPEEFKGEGFSVGQVVPELVAIDQNGDEFSLWQFYGQVVILDISTMWCAPCQDLAEEVDETWKHYQDNDLMYLTVLPQNLDGEPPTVPQLNFWTDSFGITAPVVSDDKVVQLAPDGSLHIRGLGRSVLSYTAGGKSVDLVLEVGRLVDGNIRLKVPPGGRQILPLKPGLQLVHLSSTTPIQATMEGSLCGERQTGLSIRGLECDIGDRGSLIVENPGRSTARVHIELVVFSESGS